MTRNLSPDDVWLVPDGWANALSLGFRVRAKCVLFCQNWAYLFDGLPEGVRRQDLPVSFLAVPHPVTLFMEEVLGSLFPIVRPYIDETLFYLPAHKQQTPPVRIPFMPRKNSRLVTQVQRIVRERRPDLFARIEWVSIQGKSRSEVGDILRSCHLFVASGFPEGFSLPPLEAMACGAIPVGFTGLGGWDYMRQASNMVHASPFELRSVPWGGNGLFYADGDVLGVARGVEEMAGALLDNPESGASLIRAGQITARTYGQNSQQEELHSWIKSLGRV